MHYDKQIRYLEYLENGEKIRSAGFVKIEIIDNVCNIQVNVTGLHPSENCTREVRLIGIDSAETISATKGKEAVLGEIALQNGKGSLIKKRIPIDSLCEGISYYDLATVRMNLGKSRELVCRWREEAPKEPEEPIKEQQEPVKKPVKEQQVREKEPRWSAEALIEQAKESAETEALIEQAKESAVTGAPIGQAKESAETGASVERAKVSQQEQAWMQGQPPQESQQKPEEAIQPIQAQADVCNESYQAQEEMSEIIQAMQPTQPPRPLQALQPTQPPRPEATQLPRPESPYVPGPTMPATLHEKKWRQLSEIYPHIAPFRDERDYLSIGPGDFVILPEKYYRLINNSFLLHGFYNYGHMVLTRTMKRGEEKYYIGVPGNFYENERQVAIMFGFESFECRQEPARDGDFGYYMIRVEL